MLLLKNSTIVEVVKSHLAPQRALDLVVVCLTTRKPRDYINKAGGQCGNRRCRVGYLSSRIAHDKAEEAAQYYVNCTAVVIELLKDSKEQTKRRMNMRAYGVALYKFLDVRVKFEDGVKEEMRIT